MKKLHKVEDRLERNEEKYQEKFGESPYSMEGPLNQAWHEGGSDRLFKTMDKIVEAHDEGNFKKVVRKGRQAYRQAARQGLVDPGEKSKKFQRIYPPTPNLSLIHI